MQSFKTFFTAPTYPDEETSRRAGLLSFLLNLHILVAIGTTLLNFFTSSSSIYTVSPILAGLLGLGMRYLLLRRRLILSSNLFLVMALLIMPTVAWFSGSSAASITVTIFQFMTVVMAGLLVGGIGTGVFVLFTIILNGSLIYAEMHNLYTVDVARDPVSTWLMQIVTFSAVAAILFVTNRLIHESFRRAQEENDKRRAAEEKVRKLNEDLEARVHERTAQLEAANQELEAFAYSVSHDLRAPLRAIINFTRIAKDDFYEGVDAPGRNYLEKVIDSGTRMNRLIDDLLDFSRIGQKPIRKQAVDMGALVHTIIESLAPETANRQIKWILTETPPAQADPTLIQQVYTNLISNAVKYSSKRNPAQIEIGSIEKDNETIWFVKDNGAGFDMQYSHKLFGVFQRLHGESEFEGTGIGLAIVQRIILRHGGRIWAEAEPDKGATFYFTLG